MDKHRLTPQERQERFARERKGRTSEERFRHLLSDPAKKPAWIVKVEHSNRPDDYGKGIDFWVYTTTGWKIPVDVKSSMRGLRKHIAIHGPLSVCVVVMFRDIDDDTMRLDALDIIMEFQENAIRNGTDSNFKS